MWIWTSHPFRRTWKFFRLTLGNDNLSNHYKINFVLVQHHKYSLAEIENMLPWERDLYIGQLEKYIQEENERLQKLQNR